MIAKLVPGSILVLLLIVATACAPPATQLPETVWATPLNNAPSTAEPSTPRIEGGPQTPPLPPMVLVERIAPDGALRPHPLLHFVDADGSDTVVPAEGYGGLDFQVAGQRVYYGGYYANREGIVPLNVPEIGLPCRPPLPTPEGDRLAWICENLSTASFEALEQGGTFDFKMAITDGEGNEPHVVWQHTETGPLYNTFRLVSWQADGESVAMTMHAASVAWPRFDYHPNLLWVRLDTGEETPIGDPDAGDAALSDDGHWLAQAFHGEPDVVRLRSLADSAERTITGTEGVEIIGDFSFSPGNIWLVWQECPDLFLPPFRLRALRLPDGEPFTVHEAEVAEQSVAGWLGPDELVVVRNGEGPVGSSYLITLPFEGAGSKISPHDFLGVPAPSP
jgi:hypothetical protein